MGSKKDKTGSDHVCSAKKVDNIIATIDLNGNKLINRSFSHGKHSCKFEAFDWDVDIKEGTTSKLLLLV
jgi:hypothetical protein